MTKFRKKPIVIEAVQFLGPAHIPKDGPIPDGTPSGVAWQHFGSHGRRFPIIETLDGVMDVRVGDWIITGASLGERYPCKPGIFAANYEPL